MGTFTVEIEIGDPQGERWERFEATVDTGSLFTVVPRRLLERLGVQPCFRGRFLLGDGRVIEEDVGQTWIRVEGKSGIRMVAFGGGGPEAILGADTLDGLLLEPEEEYQRLVPKIGLMPTLILVE
jgi:predicted aspartyl protease